ncbi:MAG TPA: hypothetical protein VFO29_08795 [Candidatus Rubrimentiphilum sp.]|nr:hypothetical protein [Candidatus Rubrimentiphilum sp.]
MAGIAAVIVGIAVLLAVIFVGLITKSHADSVASVSGVAITVLGFAITLIQLHRTETAASAANKAVGTVRADLGRYDTLTELTKAASTLQTVSEMHRDKKWAQLHERYSDVKRSLATVKAMHATMKAEHAGFLDSTAAELTEMDNYVEKFLNGQGVPEPDIASFNKSIYHQLDWLNEVSADIRSQVGMK